MGYNARPNQGGKYMQGQYQLINEKKYIANPNEIYYRSSLEYKFCKFIDNSSKVIKWGSEVVGVPYTGADNKPHTYYVDYYLEMHNPKDPMLPKRLLVEVKPQSETERIINNTPPPQPKKVTPKSLANWEYALREFDKNKRKWYAAQEYARLRSMEFVVVTEKNINMLITA
jgi:hypothetical protein